MGEPDTVSATGPLAAWALAQQRRSLVAWIVAVAAVSGLYIGFWPSMEGFDVDSMVENLPEGMVEAMGYDRIGTAAGYLSSTLFGLIGPALLMVFATIKGAALLAGDEENGTLELELTAPVPRRRLYLGRLAALWLLLGALAGTIALLTLALIVPLDMDVAAGNVVVTSAALWLLAGMVGTVALAGGADVSGMAQLVAMAVVAAAVGAIRYDHRDLMT